MARIPGTFPFSANYEATIQGPLDARLVVGTLNDLTLSTGIGYIPYPYKGMIVSVTSDSNANNNGVYVLTDDNNPRVIGSWLKLGSGTGTLVSVTQGTYTTITGSSTNPTIDVNTSLIATRAYVDSSTVGLLDDRGSYAPTGADANLYPSTTSGLGGSGVSGAIMKGDLWYISAAGTMGTVSVSVGDTVRALVDNPVRTNNANWAVITAGVVPSLNQVTNVGATTTNNLVVGSIKTTNKATLNTDGSVAGTSFKFQNTSETLKGTLGYNSGITTARTWTLPDAGGTIPLTVNGISPNATTGDITVPVGTILNLSQTGFVKISGGAIVYDNSTYLTSAITSLGGLTGAIQTFANDTNVTITSSGSAHTLGWTGILPISRGGTNSGTALNNNKAIISSGGAIVESSVTSTELGYLTGVTSAIQTQINGKQNLNSILTALTGLSYSSGTPFIKMTGASTFTLDTNTYLTTTSATSTYVPYTGATTNVNLGVRSLTANGGVYSTSEIVCNASGQTKSALSFNIISGNTRGAVFLQSFNGSNVALYNHDQTPSPSTFVDLFLPNASGTLLTTVATSAGNLSTGNDGKVTIPDAGTSTTGLVTAALQTFAGTKIFSNQVEVNSNIYATGDIKGYSYNGLTASGTNVPAPTLTIYSGKGTGNAAGGDINISTYDAGGTSGTTGQTASTKMIIKGTTGIVGIGTTIPDVSSILDLTSSNKGFLPPRMTWTSKVGISSPAEGLMVYQTNTSGTSIKGAYLYNGTGWQLMSLPYKKYVVMIEVSSGNTLYYTSVLENEIGTITINYNTSTKVLTFGSSGLFTAGKTGIFTTPGPWKAPITDYAYNGYIVSTVYDSSNIQLGKIGPAGVLVDSYTTMVEIRVYN